MASDAYQKPKKSLKTTRILIAVFLILILAVLGAFGFYVLRIVQDYDEDRQMGLTGTEQINATVLFVFYDDSYTSTAPQFLLTNFNSESGNIRLSVLPADLKVQVKTIDGTLSEQYTYGGVLQVKSAVETLLDIEIDKYVGAPFSTLESVIKDLGGVEFTLDDDLYYENDDGELITTLKKGKQTLSGQQAMQYIRYGGWASASDTAANRAQMAKSVVEQNLDEETANQIMDLYADVSSSLTTDLSIIEMSRFNDVFLSFKQAEIIRAESENGALTSGVLDSLSSAFA